MLNTSQHKRKSYRYTSGSTLNLYQTIPERLEYFSRKYGQRDACIMYSPAGEKSCISCDTLFHRSVQFAKGLLDIGIQKGDVVGVSLPHSITWLICTFGVQMVGGIALPFYFNRSDGSDVISILNSVEKCKAVIFDLGEDCKNYTVMKRFVNFSSTVSHISESITSLKFVICDQWRDKRRSASIKIISEVEDGGKINASCMLPGIDPDDFALFLLTSGSTGTPKIVPKTHFSLILTGCHFCLAGDMTEDDIYYSTARFSFITGFPGPYLYRGITQVSTGKAPNSWTSINDLNQAAACAIVSSKSTVAFLPVPSMQYMAAGNIPDCEKWPLKTIITGGVPVSERISDLVGRISLKISNLYGSTELGMISEFSFSKSNDYTAYNVGTPFPGVEMKVVDEQNEILEIGKVGEIFVRHNDRFLGYVNNYSQTAKVHSLTGWFKTDDIGYVGDNDSVYVTGRKSDVIIIGGINVLPFDTEEAANTHPDVEEVCVVAVEDEIMFQEQCACVVMKSGKALGKDELLAFLSEKFTSKSGFLKLNVPKYILFFETLPKTRTQKLFRRKVAELAKERLKKDKISI